MEASRKWADLGLDCLVNVFQRLELEDKTEGVPFVCKSWREASLNPLCWHRINLASLKSQFLERRNHVSGKSSYLGLLRFLADRSHGSAVKIIFPDSLVRLQEVAYFVQTCPMLEVLALPRIHAEEEELLPGLAQSMKNLRRLHMRYKPSSFRHFIQQISCHCKNLVGLQVCGKFEDVEDMAAITTLLPGLRYLCLSGSLLSGDSLRLALAGCAELEELYAEECRGFYVGADMLMQASHLKAFECRGSRPSEIDPFDSGDSLDSDEIWERIFGRFVWCGGDYEVLVRACDEDD